MQTYITPADDYKEYISFEKYSAGEKASEKGAFPLSLSLSFALKISRRLGICACRLHVENALDSKRFDLDFVYTKTELCDDIYTLSIDFKKLCENRDSCLFYYYITLYSDENNIFYISSVNNFDFEITRDESDIKRFRLLLYSDGFETPDWAKSAVMYHIFVDRFSKSQKHTIPQRADSVIIEDWENGIPEFAPYNGAPMKNNTFFGGNLYGICEKLPYLKDLGINVIYLSPIFKAYSNHKYDTGDYECVDEMFGGQKAFDELITKAQRLGIRIILDGVFNHTGDDSKYFNKYGSYNSVGAYQSKDSIYANWYDFKEFPDKYSCWWGIKILPKLNNVNPETVEYFLGSEGIVRKWLKHGTSGWRLDVADELPSEFLDILRKAVKTQNPDALIIGEVWENAADKIAYGKMREYFLGNQLDSVMNYPIRNAIIDFCTKRDAESFYNTVTDIYSSYPPFCSAVLMNILGTHDTERILTVLSGVSGEKKTNAELSQMRLDEELRNKAVDLLKTASVLQFTLPGMPSVFYGDEAGLEGYHDPFCRRPFPWGHEDSDLTEHYKKLCQIKRHFKALHGAELKFTAHTGSFICFEREHDGQKLIIAVNLSDKPVTNLLDGVYTDLLSHESFSRTLNANPAKAYILCKEKSTDNQSYLSK